MADNGVPTPAALRPPTTTPATDPKRFGRVEADGTVILHAPEGDVVVGQWAAGDPADGLAFFGRRYDDLVVEIDLIDKRLSDHRAPAEQAEAVLTRVREALAARSFVGDVAALETRCTLLEESIAEAKEATRARRAAQREEAMVARKALAEEAESLGDSTSWRVTTERYAAIVEEWKGLPRGDRAAEQEFWQRISAARTAFDKRRRQHFSELDATRKVAVARKRELISSAEALSSSTDWARTGKQLRDLLGDWKEAPRASRAEEDRLWKRFKAAQDAFYAARTAAGEAEEEGLRENVPAKESLLAEAEALVPVSDLKAAKSSLRSIQERWDKAGDIPRSDRDRLEGRLKRVEEALRKAESEAWRRSNPEAKARAESTASAFSEGLARLRKQHDAAVAAGNTAKAADLAASISSTEALLAAAEGAISDYSGG